MSIENVICFIIGWIIGDMIYNIYKWNKLDKWIKEQEEFKKDVEEFIGFVTENLEQKTKLITKIVDRII